MNQMHILDLNFLDIPQTVAAFLLPSSEGPILIETGPHSTLAHLHAGIRHAGFEPEEVKHVFLSHIHLDHAGAAWWFAQHGAQVYVHPKGLAHLADPAKLMASAKMIYQDEMDRLWGEMHSIEASQLVAVEHGQLFKLGELELHAWHTPGHAVHHIAWQWGDKLFTGDVAGVKIGNGLVAPPCPPPDINLPDWLHSIELMRQLPIKTLYLTHFGEVPATENHWAELSSRLENWANWMKPYYEQGTSVADVSPLFQQYVKEELQASGLDALGLSQYQAANPSEMSVTGLMRYWKKALA